MKKIEAVIEPFKLDEIKQLLHAEKLHRVNIFEMKGAGCAQGKLKQYRGVHYVEDAFEIKVEAIVDDDDSERIVEAILAVLRSGDLCDGEVLVLPVEKVATLRRGRSDLRRSH
jgi:nitrogen regulatory protein P-II 1